ncbi:MAG: cation:proton antiporter [Nitrososphaeria archaeon]
MISTISIFIFFSAIIFIGFFGNMIFKRTGFPEIFFLIAFGFIVGPVLGLFPLNLIKLITPAVSSLTLAMILFSFGLEINVMALLKESLPALLRTLLYVGLGIISNFLILVYIFNWPLYSALFLSTTIGGETTVTVVGYYAKALSRDKSLFVNVTVEAALNSLIIVVLFSTLINSYLSNISLDIGSVKTVVASFFSRFSVSFLFGVAAALLWLKFIKIAYDVKYLYIATFGYLLLTYASTEIIGGSGVISVITLGLVFANSKLISDPLSLRLGMPEDVIVYLSRFQDEISFFLRTFFFVLLGLEMSIPTFLDLENYVMLGAIMLALLSSRFVATYISDRHRPAYEKRFIFMLMGQGLTPAVIATMIVEYGVPYSQKILSIVTMVILATNIVALMGAKIFKAMNNRM